MNLLGASNLFMGIMNVYNKLKYIKDNRVKEEEGKVINIYQLENEYDGLLENLETMYEFPNTKENRRKLQSFLLRYSEKITKEYERTRSAVKDKTEVSVIKPMTFEMFSEKEKTIQ